MSTWRSFRAQMAARDTSEGRRFEVKIITFDCNVLSLGIIGLALSLPPLVYIAASGHIFANFRVSPIKWLGLIIDITKFAIWSALIVAATYAVQAHYFHLPSAEAISNIRASWHQLVAIAIVAEGVILNLFAYPGCLYKYIEELDRARPEKIQTSASSSA